MLVLDVSQDRCFCLTKLLEHTVGAAQAHADPDLFLAGAVDLMHRIRTDFKHRPKATIISTPLNEVFEKRHGACRDFAHVMIAGLCPMDGIIVGSRKRKSGVAADVLPVE